MTMTPKQQAYEALSQTLIKELGKRNMKAEYFSSKENCLNRILELIPTGSTVSNGGSSTLTEIGLLAAIQSGDYEYIDRSSASTPEEKRVLFSKIVMADYYLMSTNALTLDGQLINIDGNGNRIACLVQGPEHVFIVCGMNKIVSTVEEGIHRTRNIAAPPNVKRLKYNTPCSMLGKCGDCLSTDCICSHIVITRRSKHPERIWIFLVGEELGY